MHGYLHDSGDASSWAGVLWLLPHRHTCSHLDAHSPPTLGTFAGRLGSLAVPQLCHVLFQIRHRDDALPLAHVAIAVEGPGWANPDNVALQVASAIIGHYDCTYGGGTVSPRGGHGMGPCLQGREGAGLWALVLWGLGVDRRQEGGC